MKRRLFIKSLAAAGLLSTTTACFGSFKATRWVYDLNKGISGNKFIQWFVFLALVIVPVYEIASFIDVLILNSLEFWFGGSGTAEAHGDERLVQLSGDESLWMRREVERGLLHVRYEAPDKTIAMTFQMSEDGARLVDGNGALMGSIRGDGDGGVEVLSGGRVLDRFDAQTVRGAVQEFEDGGATATAAWARAQMAPGALASK
jgi:hypothetical protein